MSSRTTVSRKASRMTLRFAASVLVLALMVFAVGAVYSLETQQTERGKADFRVSYHFYLKNEGPIDLTSVTVRLALLKDWIPVQTVEDLAIDTFPNQTTTDIYENEFVWYDYRDFKVNQSIDLWFHANLTLPFVDYASADLPITPYNTELDIYKLYTAFEPLADSTDPSIRNVAQSLEVLNDPLGTAFNLYNFTASFLDYRLMSSTKGASYALRNGVGDCDEYTYLFVALSRSLGIPAVEHTAWLADFAPGFVTSDEGAVAHAYPMFYIEGVGLVPADPTRGKSSIFDNWLRTDYKRITLTRGPDNPYRLLRYRWLPIEGLPDPSVFSNYTIIIHDVNIQYTSILRNIILVSLVGIPVVFGMANVLNGYQLRQLQKKKLEELLSPG
ncbi:MAG: transglutaminase family protein [Candidatus Thorarchaeota archaeon]